MSVCNFYFEGGQQSQLRPSGLQTSPGYLAAGPWTALTAGRVEWKLPNAVCNTSESRAHRASAHHLLHVYSQSGTERVHLSAPPKIHSVHLFKAYFLFPARGNVQRCCWLCESKVMSCKTRFSFRVWFTLVLKRVSRQSVTSGAFSEQTVFCWAVLTTKCAVGLKFYRFRAAPFSWNTCLKPVTQYVSAFFLRRHATWSWTQILGPLEVVHGALQAGWRGALNLR